ncbi:hypothetical protein ACIBEJ_51485 [Nonomuraea sp. NPDC050790]|uniref:hypothetical protein n=1 Tax=Nonomuraea sp. NPDC050790 TaxID=3364371 RepID=UPI0037AFD216
MRRILIGALLATGLTFAATTGAATAATSVAADCSWNKARLNVNKTVYRTLRGWTPKGSIKRGTVVYFYDTGIGTDRVRVPAWNGYIKEGGMTVLDGGTCPS